MSEIDDFAKAVLNKAKIVQLASGERLLLIEIPPLGDPNDGLRNPYAKLIEEVNESIKSGYAFEGIFLKSGKTSIALRRDKYVLLLNTAKKIGRKKSNTAYLFEISKNDIKFAGKYDYNNDFQSLLERVSEILTIVGEVISLSEFLRG